MRMILVSALAALVLTPAVCAQTTSRVLAATGTIISSTSVSPPAVLCVGGQPTGAQPLCSTGSSRILTWNGIMRHELADFKGPAAAMVRGSVRLVTHCNLNERYFGYCWGTLEWTAPEMDGRWEGSFHLTIDMLTNTVAASATAQGAGGKLDGLQMKYEAVYPGGTQPGVFVAKISSVNTQ